MSQWSASNIIHIADFVEVEDTSLCIKMVGFERARDDSTLLLTDSFTHPNCVHTPQCANQNIQADDCTNMFPYCHHQTLMWMLLLWDVVVFVSFSG